MYNFTLVLKIMGHKLIVWHLNLIWAAQQTFSRETNLSQIFDYVIKLVHSQPCLFTLCSFVAAYFFITTITFRRFKYQKTVVLIWVFFFCVCNVYGIFRSPYIHKSLIISYISFCKPRFSLHTYQLLKLRLHVKFSFRALCHSYKSKT